MPRWITFWCGLTFVLLSCVAIRAAEWMLLPEPRFMDHKITAPIAGAKETVLAVARPAPVEFDFPTPAQWMADGGRMDAALAETRRLSVEWLRDAKIEFVRDERKVVGYAVVRAERAPVCAAVLAPEFRAKFEDVFGPKMLVVMPTRHTVFVFPSVAGKHREYAKPVLAAWRTGQPRVSLEVFELSAGGLKAAGIFEE